MYHDKEPLDVVRNGLLDKVQIEGLQNMISLQNLTRKRNSQNTTSRNQP